jgi:hypothetical protein
MVRIAKLLTPIIAPVLLAAAIFVSLRLLSSRPISALVAGIPELLRVDSPTFRCSAHPGEIVAVEFSVQNETADAVKLLGANSSCGCTVVAEEFPIQLAPHDVAKIHVNIRIGSPDAAKQFVRTVDLLTNREGFIPTLTVEATVVPVSPTQ